MPDSHYVYCIEAHLEEEGLPVDETFILPEYQLLYESLLQSPALASNFNLKPKPRALASSFSLKPNPQAKVSSLKS